MTLKLSGVRPPTGEAGDVTAGGTGPGNVTALAARRKVNTFVVTEISTQLRGEAPELIGGARPCWSVPVGLTSPVRGEVGKVGEILVDAITGELLVDEALVQRMTEDARHLAERSPL